MMKFLFFTISALILSTTSIYAQETTSISSLDFVKVLNNNTEEALFYYENNWKQLRIKAIEKGYIENFKLLKVLETNADFQFILETTYANKAQFEKRETHFQELIKEHGPLKLLNDKKPEAFRKTVYWSDTKHL